MQASVYERKYSQLSRGDVREALEREGYDVLSWSDGPGKYYPEHSHPHDEFIVVVSGGIVFEIGGRSYPLQPGDCLHLPANTVHTAVNEGSVPVSYFICTTRTP
jgi:quercetin dioxygenase-like cupin family protein